MIGPSKVRWLIRNLAAKKVDEPILKLEICNLASTFRLLSHLAHDRNYRDEGLPLKREKNAHKVVAVGWTMGIVRLASTKIQSFLQESRGSSNL
jgi:hypothetical protein